MGMKHPSRAVRAVIVSGILALAGLPAAAADAAAPRLTAGLVFDYSNRTVQWAGDDADSRMTMGRLSVQAALALGRRMKLTAAAGLSLSDFSGLVFRGLPISLAYESGPAKGLAVAVGFDARLLRFGDFEMTAGGRLVSSFGLTKTWPLEGFAVPGQARGRVNWMEAAAGPRLAYKFFGRFVPYVEAAVRWLRADFRMDERLEDLEGREKKTVKGDVAVSIALGADFRAAKRLSLGAKAGFMPFAGGVDSLVTAGLTYVF